MARARGAEATTTGSTAEIRGFYRRIAALLEAKGMRPLYRQSGLRPHITLGYGTCAFAPVAIAWHWTPRDLVLIESHIGHRRHRVLQSWSLPPPEQASFAFMEDGLAPPLRDAA